MGGESSPSTLEGAPFTFLLSNQRPKGTHPMSEILLKADEARGHAVEMKNAANDARDRFESMRGRLNQLAESFRGQAATAFESRYHEWAQGSQQVIEALEGLSHWLDSAANTIEDTDAQLAGGLN